MKTLVGFDGVTPCRHVGLEVIQGFAQAAQLLVAAAQRRQAGGFCLQADAQLQHRQHVHRGGNVGAFQPEHARRTELGGLQHKGAHTMVRLHEARGLQLGQGLTHHRAADAIDLHDGRLGGQLVTGAQLLVADLVTQVVHQCVGQAPATPAWYHGLKRLCGSGFRTGSKPR